MGLNKIIRITYYFSKRLINGITHFIKELSNPTSFLKGDDFEGCLRKKVFTSDKYELIMKTHNFLENKKDYVKSSLYPDYLFRNMITNEEFWVEAKYRENLFKEKIEWCNYHQLTRYKKHSVDNNTKVIIAIGFGGRPKNPHKIYLIPLEKINFTGLYPSSIAQYEHNAKRKNIIDKFKDNLYNLKK